MKQQKGTLFDKLFLNYDQPTKTFEEKNLQ